MPSGFKLNQAGIRQFKRELEKSLNDRDPVRVRIDADPASTGLHHTTYNGPVVIANGERAQIAWGNEQVSQVQDGTRTDVAVGYEEVAALLADLVRDLGTANLSASQELVVRRAADDALHEVSRSDPDRAAVNVCLAAVIGVLHPIAMGAAEGAGDAARSWSSGIVTSLLQMIG